MNENYEDYDKKVQVSFRMSKYDFDIFNTYVQRCGISREEYLRTLCGLVTVLDVNPSAVAKLKPAYIKSEHYE